MNRRQKIIISVTGIFLVMLILTGLTYAYFLTRITGNTNETSISLSTAKLELVYGDGNGILKPEGKIMPGNTIGTKTFTVTNNGNSFINQYSVVLRDLNIYFVNAFTRGGERIELGTPTRFERPQDFIYTITCESSLKDEKTGKPLPCSSDNDKNKMFPTTEDILITNSIQVGETHYYSFELKYIEANTNQSVDMNKGLTALIDIIDSKNTINIKGNVTDAKEGDSVEIIKQENVAYVNGTDKIKLLGNEDEEKIVTYVDKEGNYQVVGLKPGEYRVRLNNSDNQTSATTDIQIIKGTTEGIQANTVTITEESSAITLDVVKNELEQKEFTIGSEIENKAFILSERLMNDTRIVKNEDAPIFNGVESNEVGMYSADDDYGNSWYFRGKQSYNYVNFAGFTWRVVRINGDESVRLILNNSLDQVRRKNEDGTTGENVIGERSKFNALVFGTDENAHVGYMYGNFTGNTTTYDQAHKNEVESTIKQVVDEFYETYIENDTNNYHYGEYLADTMFCGDKTLASDGIDGIQKQYGYGLINTYYAAAERIFYSTDESGNSVSKPTLECAKGVTENEYSRYTANAETTPKGVKVNKDLDYPIALLSADEMIMAGEYVNSVNASYLYDEGQVGMWTMTPRAFISYVFSAGIFSNSISMKIEHNHINYDNGVRPVINLKAEVGVSGGNGTKTSPYEIKLD